jgi:hypothetical protein
VDTRLYGKLKKMEGVNILLFSHVEREDSAELRRKIKAQEEGKAIDDDDIFDRGGEESEESDEAEEGGEGGLNGEERKKAKLQGREETKRKQDIKLAEARSRKEDHDEIDIDAI